MHYLYIVYTSTVSLIVLFLITKLIGNKQMSELNMFDYINGITIGSIAAEAATSIEKNFTYTLTAMIVYGVLAFFISFVCIRSQRIRRLFNGKSISLITMGKIHVKNLKKARLDVNELLTQLRYQGYFNIDDVAFAYLEPNGGISVLPVEKSRNSFAGDFSHDLKQTLPAVTLVVDGVFLDKNIASASLSRERIIKEAKATGARNEKDIFLAVSDGYGKISVYLNHNPSSENDIFQ